MFQHGFEFYHFLISFVILPLNINKKIDKVRRNI